MMASQDPVDSGVTEHKDISLAINQLGFHLYKLLSVEKGNVFFSPLSISTALAITFCGSKNKTAEEMRSVLKYELCNIKDEEVKVCFDRLLSSLDKDQDSYALKSANVVLSQYDFHVKENFKKLLKESFKAMILEVDFRKESDKAVQVANEWVKNKTADMIPHLLESLDEDTVLVILNAVYFKGMWLNQFKEKATYLQNFYNKGLEENPKQIEMMHLKQSFLFTEQDDFRSLQLPYKGDEIAMLILLPNERDGVEKLESKLSADLMQKIKLGMRKRRVNVALPKFRVEYTKSLKPEFQNLGMISAFCPGAHFSEINDSPALFISEIIHKAVLVINEEGTEAAAATAVVMQNRCLTFDPEFIVDHPFLFLIYNYKTDLIMFLGKVDEL